MRTYRHPVPRIAEKLLTFFMRHDTAVERLADFEEIFQFMAEEEGIVKAKNWYWQQTFRSIPGLIYNSIYWSLVMLKSYLIIGMRNLYRNKLYSLINIVGLGAAIAVCITGYVNYQYSQSFDDYHLNADNIHLVGNYRIINHNRLDMSPVPTPLAPALKRDLPGIEQYTRLARNRGVLRYQDKVFNETIYFLDKNFFDIFTFPLIQGDPKALHDKNSMVINDEIAAKYFGDKDPIGQQIIFSPNGDQEYVYVVGGVIAKPPTNSSMLLTVCLPYERQVDMLNFDIEAWNDWTSAAFIQTSPQVSPAEIESKLQDYLGVVNEANSNYRSAGFFLIGLPQLSKATRTMNNRPFNTGFHLSQIIAPSVIALLVLLLACFNFVNTAIAFASRRFKEIGIRKVIGGQRSQLIHQFLGENLLLCLFAFILGLFLAHPFTMFYDSLFPENAITLNYYQNPELITFLVILLFITATAAGAYPALYISRFSPVMIFSGKQKIGGTNRMIRVLLSVQFAISITAILASIILYNNSKYIENFDLGFDKEQVMVVPVNGEKNYQLLKASIQDNPDILSIGASEHSMDRSFSSRDIEIDDNTSRIHVLNIGENYFETVGMQLIDGQIFDPERQTEAEQSIIVTEKITHDLGIHSPIGRYIKFTSEQPASEYRVVGVAKDFHLSGLWQEVRPVVLRYAPPERIRFLSLKFNLNNVRTVSEFVQSTWKTLFPHLPYEGYFQSEILAETAAITDAIQQLFLYIAMIVVLTSGMGLFALVSLNIVKRTKEFGIRKVLGANIFDISYLVSREFIIVLVGASLIGSALGYFSIEALMGSIWAYYTDFGILPFILATLLMIIITLLTVSSQVATAARANPVDSLRYE